VAQAAFSTPRPIRTASGTQDVLPDALYVYEESFKEQMLALKNSGIPVLDPRNLEDFFDPEKDFPDFSVLICFDDLWKAASFYAYPLLKALGFKVLAFKVEDWLFEKAQALDPMSPVCLSHQELEERQDVFITANHSSNLHSRNASGTAFTDASKQELEKDLQRCENTVALPGLFAYPFGRFSDTSLELLKDLGFSKAFTTQAGIIHPDDNALLLKRTLVPRTMNLEEFKNLLHP